MTSICRNINEVTIEKIRQAIVKAEGKDICPYCGEKRNINPYGIPQFLVDALKARKNMIY